MPLALTQLDIDGFRGLRQFEMRSLGRVNLLVGENNSGKTSVLEAISVVSQPSQPAHWLDLIRWRDPGGIDESRVDSLRWCFSDAMTDLHESDRGWSGACRFVIQGRAPLTQLDVNAKEIRGQPSPAEIARLSRLSRTRFSEQDVQEREWQGAEIVHRLTTDSHLSPPQFEFVFWQDLPIQLSLSQDESLGFPCKVLAAYSYQGNPRQVSTFSKATDVDKAALVNLLQQFDVEVSDVMILSKGGIRPTIYLKHRRLGVAPLSIFGDAMRRAVLLASTLTGLPAGSVLLMDEAEAGIHVGAQQRFFAWVLKAAQERDVQVFMTTHSLETLDALLTASTGDASDEGLVVYKLRRHDDIVQTQRFAGDLLHRLRFDRGLDVR